MIQIFYYFLQLDVIVINLKLHFEIFWKLKHHSIREIFELLKFINKIQTYRRIIYFSLKNPSKFHNKSIFDSAKENLISSRIGLDSLPLQGHFSIFLVLPMPKERIGKFSTLATNHWEKMKSLKFPKFKSPIERRICFHIELNKCKDHLARWFVCFRSVESIFSFPVPKEGSVPGNVSYSSTPTSNTITFPSLFLGKTRLKFMFSDM